MANRWRVRIEAVEELGNPSYRPGDFIRRAKHALAEDEDALKDVTVEVGSGESFQQIRTFNVPPSGSVRINEVLFVKPPPRKQPLVFRVKKEHRIQKDALIGEATVDSVGPTRKLELLRHDKPRGFLIVEVSDGLRKPEEGPPPGASSGGTPQPTRSAKSVASGATTATSATPSGASGGDAPQQPSGCASCMSGLAALLGQLQGLLGLEPSGAAFLEKKAQEPDVVKLRSGLMYKVLKKGTHHHHPTSTSTCDCHYKGTLVSGKTFDSSYDGRPVPFAVGSVIPGFAEALQLMVEGDKWELYVPPELGYGDARTGPIPPGSVLIFELELIKIRGGRR